MSRQSSLVGERYREPSSTITTSFMADMAKGVDGVEVEATVNTYCHVLALEIDGLQPDAELSAQSLKLCQTDSTRAYLLTEDVTIEEVLGKDWEVARLSGIEDHWEEVRKNKGLYFLSVSKCTVPETQLEPGTAFRVPTRRDGQVYHTAKADSVIAVFRTRGLKRLPRPEMQAPYVEEAWMALAAVLSRSERDRPLRLGKNAAFSTSFHLSDSGEVVSELSMEMNMQLSVVSPIDEDGLRELAQEAESTFYAMRRHAGTKWEPMFEERLVKVDVSPKDGSIGALVESILGEQIYAKEDATRLRFLRLWQALVDASDASRLADLTVLASHEPKELDNIRNRIAHPSGLPRGSSSTAALGRLRSAALEWVRNLQ